MSPPETRVSLVLRWRFLRLIAADRDLSRTDVAIAMFLLDLMGDKITAWPSYKTIAENTGQKERNAKYCIERLAAKGYFRVQKGKGRGHRNTFQPAFEKVHATAPFDDAKGAAACTLSASQKVQPHAVKGAAACPEKVQPLAPPYTQTHRHSEKTQTLSPEIESEFADFWNAYPRHVDRKQAFKAYQTARKKTGAATLLTAAKHYAEETTGKEQRYIKHGATWLNGECWNNEPASNGGYQRDPFMCHWPSRTDQDAPTHTNSETKLSPMEQEDADWRRRLSRFKETGFWSNGWGYPPSDQCCTGPRHLLVEFGYRDATEEAKPADAAGEIPF